MIVLQLTPGLSLLQGKGRRESEGHKSCRRPSNWSPTSAEKRTSVESVSSLPEGQPDPEPGAEQEEVFVAVEGPGPEEMPSDRESPESLQLDAQAGPLGTDPPGDPLDFVVPESPEDLKALSSEEEEDVGAAQEPDSLLPSSVLDQASVIAERFVSSFSRRSSLALDDGRSSGVGTPRPVSRSSSLLSLEGSDKGPAVRASPTSPPASQPPPEAEVDVGVGMATEGGTSVDGPELPGAGGCPAERARPSCRGKDSLLSTRDRLLLDKIKSYYESAEHHDAGFSVRRRESLSYIPKGLVRNSVSRINSLPRPDAEPAGCRRPAGSRPASWALFDLPGPSQAGADDPAPVSEAEFRPSSEMVKMWETMEASEGGPRGGPGQTNGFDLHEPLFILEEHELGAITEEAAAASPESASPTEHLARELKELVRELSGGAQGELVAPLHPRIVQLSHVMDGRVSQRVKNKVYQLARQYSLRIKNRAALARPPLQWERAAPDKDGGRSPTSPCPQQAAREPSGATAKRKPLLALNPEQPASPEHRDPKASPAGDPSAASPRTTSPGVRASSRSPLSPFDTETFSWPDVRELCSKYASHDEAVQAEGGRPRGPPVNRSHSVPENMLEPPLPARAGRCCSLSAEPGGPAGGEALHVTADVTLENHRRVIVMEKAPLPAGQEEEGSGQGPGSPAAGVGQGPRDLHALEEEGPSQRGRVRNLREKFQALNSVG